MNQVDEKVFRYLDNYIKQRGYPPRRVEFVRYCGVSGDELVKALDRLEARHYIRREVGSWYWRRAIYL
jgi:DNA-binding GntR family transcriptional regulator